MSSKVIRSAGKRKALRLVSSIYSYSSAKLDQQVNENLHEICNEEGQLCANLENKEDMPTDSERNDNETDIFAKNSHYLNDSSEEENDEKFCINDDGMSIDFENFKNFNKKLSIWSINHSISNQALNELLEILREINECVPKDVNTLKNLLNNEATPISKDRSMCTPRIENSPPLSQILEELKNLQEVIVNNNEQHKKMVGKLTQEVITLRNEVRQLKASNVIWILGNEEKNLLPQFPIHSVEELIELEANLQSEELMVKQLKHLILRVGGDDVPTFIRTTIRKLISDELATKYSWSGTKLKPSIQSYFLITLIRDMCHRKFQNVDDKTINLIIQKNFLHAKDRIEKRSKAGKTNNLT